jgi:collagenase-like PrtC family protease
MQYWKIGGAFTQIPLLKKFLEIMYFVGSAEFQFTVYDAPPKLAWHGGRVCRLKGDTSDEEYIRLIKAYNSLGAGFSFIFSNSFVDEASLADKRCNQYLEACHQEGNGIVALSDALAQYVKKNYPKYKTTLSVTHMNRNADKDWYMKKFETYDIIVLLEEVATERLLSQFEPEYRSRFEVMVNELCLRGCQYRELHYKTTSVANLEQNAELLAATPEICKLNIEKYLQMSKEALLKLRSCHVDYDQLDRYKELGICHWKIPGRELDPKDLYYYLNYYIFREMGLDKILWNLHQYGVLTTEKHRTERLNALKVDALRDVLEKYNVPETLEYSSYCE